MKFSEALLEGFKAVRGNQCKGRYFEFEHDKPVACCAMGAVSVGSDGRLSCVAFADAFIKAWDENPADLNDEGMPWEHIYGMAVAAGL